MNCVVCNKNTLKIKEDTYKCESCGHTFRDFHGNSIQFHKEIYRHKDSKQWQRNNKEINEDGSINSKLFHKARALLVFKRIQKIKQYIGKNSNVLDIGSGAGTFALALKQISNSVECLEVADSLVNECRKLGFTTYDLDFLKQNFEKKYDTVVCFHVLEHVKEIDEFISKISSINNKYCIIEVPTLNCFFNKTSKKRGFDPPNQGVYDGHYHYFSPDSITKIMEKHYNIKLLESGIQDPAILIVGEKK